MNTARARTGVVVSALLSILGTGLVLAPLASTASASPGHTPVGVCHATSSDSNPYVWIVVDKDSTKERGHLMHRDEPNKRWQSAGTWNGIAHKAGDPKPDYIERLDAGVTEAWCGGARGSTKPATTSAPATTSCPTKTSPPATTTAPPTTTTAPPATTTAPPGVTPPPTTTTAPPTTTTAPPGTTPPPTTTTAPPTTTTAPPETEPGTVPATTTGPATTTAPATVPATTPDRSTTPVAARPPLAETGASSGLLTLAGLVLIALGIATYALSQPRGKHS